jgi:chorismate synthase
MNVYSYTVAIGGVTVTLGKDLSVEEAFERAEKSDVRCPDEATSEKMVARIREAKHKGDTLGGIFEVVVTNPPLGLGSYAQWDRRLTGRLAMALMSIQAMKGVEVGMGFEAAQRFGSEVHDEIFYDQGFTRGGNNAGGLEGGITTGQPIVLRTAMKPISTLYNPKKSVDILTKQPVEATIERSDICTVPAAGVVGEAVVAYEMASAFIEKFGGDTLQELRRNYDAYQDYVKRF